MRSNSILILDKMKCGFSFAVLNFLLFFLFSACSTTPDSDQQQSGSEDANAAFKAGKAKEMLYAIPSPIEVMSLLRKAGASYDKTLLNPTQNVSKYQTTRSKSLNLGIYSTDMNYASLFDQTQETMFYVKCCRQVANELGIMNAFDQETLDRIQDNLDNKDSMIFIMSDTYWIADAYLKENERANTAAMVITGGWIEGLYLSTQIAIHTPDNEKIIQRVADQKIPLNNLLLLVNGYEQDEDVKYILKDLKELKDFYMKLETVNVAAVNNMDSKTGITTIGGAKKIKLTKEQLIELSQKITTIRNRYIE